MDSSLEFVILASHGLWDVVTNEVYSEIFSVQFDWYILADA